MPKTAKYIFTVDDIDDEYYDRNSFKKDLSFLAPAEIVDEFMSMCEENNQYPWETLAILLLIERNRSVIRMRDQ